MTTKGSGLLKALGITAFAGLISFSSPSKATGQVKDSHKLSRQERVETQRGFNLGVLKSRDKKYFIYEFGFSPELEKVIKGSISPSLYSTDGRIKTKFNSDTSGALVYIPRDMVRHGESGDFGIGVKSNVDVSVCNPYGDGRKSHPIASFNVKVGNVMLPGERTDYNKRPIEENYYITVNNNYFLPSPKAEKNKSHKHSLEGRTVRNAKDLQVSVEVSKDIFNGGSGIKFMPGWRIVNSEDVGSFHLGPYLELMSDKSNTSSTNHVEEETLVGNGTYAKTEGDIMTRKEEHEPYGFGGFVSYYTKNNHLGLTLGAGVDFEETYNSLKSSGTDQLIQDGKLIDSKPYCFTKNFWDNKLVPAVNASVDYFFNDVMGIGLGVKYSGKKDSRRTSFNGNVRIKF